VRVGIAADHGGYALKEELLQRLRATDADVRDFGAYQWIEEDDYPDRIIPLARAIMQGELDRGIAVCGSGVGAAIVANKVPGVRAALIHEAFSARQGVEDDDMNLICLGGRVLDRDGAWPLVQTFLAARFSELPRHRRRLAKVEAIETLLGRAADR